MWRFSSLIGLWAALLTVSTGSFAQKSELSISGVVKDVRTAQPISFANVYLVEAKTGATTDFDGTFAIHPIQPGEYHLSVSHVGCETQEFYLNLTRDTILELFLDHNSQLLNEVTVVGEGGKATTQENQSLNAKSISENADKNLGTLLEEMAGVSTIKSGSGIAKPVIHGLYGNRVAILNNGAAQSGQQWGVDHSPEIDPLVANRITVVKGVGVLEYPGSSLGGVVLVEPKRIDDDPHVHGGGKYVFETNGLAHGLNLDLQQNTKALAWRAVGTLKKSGDRHTANYYLRNTGNEEAHLALQLEKAWGKKWFSDLYISTFNARFGVLRGAHIGNITDLQAALTRDVPFFTEDKFSYAIDAPSQEVNHHLLKFHTRFTITPKQWIDFTYAGQYNLRKEFDVRRIERADLPAMSLEQLSNFAEVKYQNFLPRNWVLKTGVQFNRTDNKNVPETGILPLIPDYIAFEYGGFGILTKSINRTTFELGGRVNLQDRRVAAISVTVPREILRYENTYASLSAMGGLRYDLSENWVLNYNVGYAQREPDINELYSNGLHQGVSGIEVGDPGLRTEASIKNTVSVKGDVRKRLFVDALFYYQHFENYIFLNPQDEIRLTIRGSFPVFRYEQADASIFGADFAATFRLTERLNLTGKYSYLRGYNRSQNEYLVYMPSNNLLGALTYQIPEVGKFQNIEMQVNNKYVFKQNNLNASQDFVEAPAAYNLLGLKISAERQLAKHNLKLFVKADNLLNASYRDYLNRQRYFADDTGINIIVGVNITF